MNQNQTHPQIAERQIIERLHTLEPTRRQRVLRNLIATALGSIPWVGGFVTAIIASRDESAQLEIDSLQHQWLREHQQRMEELACDLAALTTHLDSIGDKISDRLESESYLALVQSAERRHVPGTLVLAAACRIQFCDTADYKSALRGHERCTALG
jgi:hypothetical protein